MNILFWILIAVLAFAFITFIRKWHDYALLFTIAIGFAVNANIFNSMSVPINFAGMTFAIDSILYTGFMFAVIVCAKGYGIRKAKILSSATIAAILLSAGIEFFAKMSAFGYSFEYMSSFLGYIFSAIGTFLGIWLMLFIFEKLEAKKVNVYLNFVICILIASIVNSTIYYAGVIIVNGNITNLWSIIAGSYLGKLFCILLCLLSYFASTHWWIPNDLKDEIKKTES